MKIAKEKKNSFDKGTRRQKKTHTTHGGGRIKKQKIKVNSEMESRNKMKEKVIKLYFKKNRMDSSSSSRSSVVNKYEKGKKYITKK